MQSRSRGFGREAVGLWWLVVVGEGGIEKGRVVAHGVGEQLGGEGRGIEE